MMEALGAVIAHFVNMAASLTWMQLLLVVSGAFLGLILWLCQRASDDFDLRLLIVDAATGKVDRFAFGYVVGLVWLTWVFLFLANERSLSEWFVGLYVIYCAAPKTIEMYVAARTGSKP